MNFIKPSFKKPKILFSQKLFLSVLGTYICINVAQGLYYNYIIDWDIFKPKKELFDYHNKKFKATEHEEQLLEYKLETYIIENKPVNILNAAYDLNGNGIADTGAMYKVINPERTTTEDNARVVFFDKDEDGTLDQILLDTTQDGILNEKKTLDDR